VVEAETILHLQLVVQVVARSGQVLVRLVQRIKVLLAVTETQTVQSELAVAVPVQSVVML
jgi:hypothetical protein